jgi:hypothetical protein
MRITRSLEMDLAKLQQTAKVLDDQALIQLATEDISLVLNKNEKLTFENGYIKDGARYHLNAQLISTELVKTKPATWTEQWEPIAELTQRLNRVISAVTDEEKRRVGHTRFSLKGLISGKAKIDSSYFPSPFLIYISDVDFGQGKIRSIRVENGASTERKQSGDDLRELTENQISESLVVRNGKFVIIKTGQFAWHEEALFSPAHSQRNLSRQHYRDEAPKSYAVGEVDQDYRFLPIRSHLTYHAAAAVLKECVDPVVGFEVRPASFR